MVKFSDLNDNDNIIVCESKHHSYTITKAEIVEQKLHLDTKYKFYTAGQANTTFCLELFLTDALYKELHDYDYKINPQIHDIVVKDAIQTLKKDKAWDSVEVILNRIFNKHTEKNIKIEYIYNDSV